MSRVMMYKERRRLTLVIRKINEARVKNRNKSVKDLLDQALSQTIHEYRCFSTLRATQLPRT